MRYLVPASFVLTALCLASPGSALAKGETLLWLVQHTDRPAMVTAKQAIESQLVDLEIKLRTVIVPVLATGEAGQMQQARSAANAIKTATAIAWWRNARREVVVYVPSTDQIRTRHLDLAEGQSQPSPEMAIEALALILRATVESARAEKQALADGAKAEAMAFEVEAEAITIAAAASAAAGAGNADAPPPVVSPNSGPGLEETTTPPPEPPPEPDPMPPPEPVEPSPPKTATATAAPVEATPAPVISVGLGHGITFDTNNSLPQYAVLEVDYALTPALVFGLGYGFGLTESLDFDSVQLNFERQRGNLTATYRFLHGDRLSIGLRAGISMERTAHTTTYLSSGASGAGEGFLLQVGFPADLTVAVAIAGGVSLRIAGGAVFWLKSPTYAVTQGVRSVDVHTPSAVRPSVTAVIAYAF